MMMNLFSVFDPSIYLMSAGWIVLSFMVMLFFSMGIFFNTVSGKVKIFLFSNLFNEQKLLLSNFSMINSICFLGLFSLLLINTVSLSLYVFTPTVHLVIVFPLSMIFWLSIMLWGLSSFLEEVVSHLVPIGTPFVLLSFMVCIELISNIIRPLTLSIRLMSNMLAGHLMMELINMVILKVSFLSLTFVFLPLFILSVLEMAVSVIQAYVFFTLLTLYLSEVI